MAVVTRGRKSDAADFPKSDSGSRIRVMGGRWFIQASGAQVVSAPSPGDLSPTKRFRMPELSLTRLKGAPDRIRTCDLRLRRRTVISPDTWGSRTWTGLQWQPRLLQDFQGTAGAHNPQPGSIEHGPLARPSRGLRTLSRPRRAEGVLYCSSLRNRHPRRL